MLIEHKLFKFYCSLLYIHYYMIYQARCVYNCRSILCCIVQRLSDSRSIVRYNEDSITRVNMNNKPMVMSMYCRQVESNLIHITTKYLKLISNVDHNMFTNNFIYYMYVLNVNGQGFIVHTCGEQQNIWGISIGTVLY